MQIGYRVLFSKCFRIYIIGIDDISLWPVLIVNIFTRETDRGEWKKKWTKKSLLAKIRTPERLCYPGAFNSPSAWTSDHLSTRSTPQSQQLSSTTGEILCSFHTLFPLSRLAIKLPFRHSKKGLLEAPIQQGSLKPCLLAKELYSYTHWISNPLKTKFI